MLILGPIGFSAPWALAPLLGLGLVWWLLRATPPLPRRAPFPPLRFLKELPRVEETPATTPWWLLALRLLLAALVILAAAQPVLHPAADEPGKGPLFLVLDDGWAAASGWDRRLDGVERLLDRAERDGRPVMLLTTAPEAGGDAPRPGGLLGAGEARSRARALTPKPWPTDRETAADALREISLEQLGQVYWLSDGLGGDEAAFAAEIGRFGPVTVLRDEPGQAPLLLRPPSREDKEMTLTLQRPAGGVEAVHHIRALSEAGNLLARAPIRFEKGEATAQLHLDLPLELRNRITRLEVEGRRGAGSVVLLDGRWQRRPVGVAGGPSGAERQPLLSGAYYLTRALDPFTDVRRAGLDELLSDGRAVILLTGDVRIDARTHADLESWVERGGILVRFAGPGMADDASRLMPVALRRGERSLGGSLSWAEPAAIAPFDDASPFFGLDIPAELLVRRQLLAQPSPDLKDKTWARLRDGTPLITAAGKGLGKIVLFHVTATPDWSDLPLTGLFVDMLRRIADMAEGVADGAPREGRAAGDGVEALPPLALLDGFGALSPPTPRAAPLPLADMESGQPGPRHPPGYYGTRETRRAFNLGEGLPPPQALAALPPGVRVTGYGGARPLDLAGYLLGAAVLLFLLDYALAQWMRGLLQLRPHLGRAAVYCLLALPFLIPGRPALAAEGTAPGPEERKILAATLETRLAYVLTGDRRLDEMSRAGLFGLTDALARRSSVEPGAPIGVDIERDDILFFPLLYWPMSPEQRPLSQDTLAKLDTYMKTGGTILFDTRDVGVLPAPSGSGGPGAGQLQRLLEPLDIPPLIPVPPEHALTKAFYLLQDFPGRYQGGRVWVANDERSRQDGVSPVVIGGNDWAAAWAVDEAGRPLAATIPSAPRQRELAYRFGVNLVMYALTGNYKTDQVHVPAILERLGQ